MHKINKNGNITMSAPLELYYCKLSKLVQLNIEVDKNPFSKKLSLHKQYN